MKKPSSLARPERNAEIRRRVRAGETLSAVGADYGISRQRVEQIVNVTATRARGIASDALRAGHITKPAVCQLCGQRDALQMHHADYDHPLAVVWLCTQCHAVADDARNVARKMAVVGDPDMLRAPDAAEYLGVTVSTFYIWARRFGARSAGGAGGGGRKARLYRRAELDRLRERVVASKRHGPTCTRGHEWIPENILIGKSGRRQCRACWSLRINGRTQHRASKYAVVAALRKLGFNITEHHQNRIATDAGIVLSAGGRSPWIVWRNGEEVGRGKTVADLYATISPTRQQEAA